MKLHKKILCLLILMLLLLLAGCGRGKEPLTIDTKLSVDTSFSGSRHMSVGVPKAVYKQYFNKDIEFLKSTLTEHMPEGMALSCSEDGDGGAVIDLELPFKSAGEYQETVSAIIAATDPDAAKPVVNFDYSRSFIKNGYTIEENFESEALLKWISEMLPAHQFEFATGAATVIFNGHEYMMEEPGPIRFSNVANHGLKGMDIRVAIDTEGIIDTQITYVASNQIIAVLGDRIQEMMDELVPAGGELTYTDDANDRIYTLNFRQDNIDNFRSAMNKALRTNNTEFMISTTGDSESLAARQTITCYFDGSYFLDFTQDDTQMTCELLVSPNYTVDSCEGTYGYLEGYQCHYSRDNCIITMNLTSSDKISLLLGFAVDIRQVLLDTKIYGEHKFTRSMDIVLDADADQLIGESIYEKLQQMASVYGPEQVTLDKETKVELITYHVTLNAVSFDELTTMTQEMLNESQSMDESTRSVITGGREKKRSPWVIRYSASDRLNFSEFLRGSQIKEGITYRLSYPADYKAQFTENNFEDETAEGEMITCSSYDKIISVSSRASKLNITGIIIFALWIASLLLAVIVAILHMQQLTEIVKSGTIGDGEPVITGSGLGWLAILIAAIVCFAFMSIRLLFKIY